MDTELENISVAFDTNNKSSDENTSGQPSIKSMMILMYKQVNLTMKLLMEKGTMSETTNQEKQFYQPVIIAKETI